MLFNSKSYSNCLDHIGYRLPFNGKEPNHENGPSKWLVQQQNHFVHPRRQLRFEGVKHERHETPWTTEPSSPCRA